MTVVLYRVFFSPLCAFFFSFFLQLCCGVSEGGVFRDGNVYYSFLVDVYVALILMDQPLLYR